MQFNSDGPGGSPVDLENEDIIAAMKEMQGYIDITPADFMEIYRVAYNHAVGRIARSMRAKDVMTRQVICVNPETSLLETAERMAAGNISGIPVVNEKNEVLDVIKENLMGGHMISAVIGVAAFKLLGASMPLAAAVAVATAILAMHATKTLHPPGGATALIAVIGSSKIHALGFWYVLVPAGLGAVVMLAVAMLVNNLAPRRRYPEFWF
ncbi:MAG: HPP family protein [Desulfosalsimonas sp.]|uniref:HPP family protein n=1 Tax=Desulfosalsimonas sp. TaxID=3073848 RepID=UPI003970D551